MARAIKKVKVEGQRKHGKKFYIILTTIIVAVLAGVGIGIGLYINSLVEDESYDYFSEYAALKINYDVLEDIIEEDNFSDIFIFVYNDDTFRTLNPHTDKDTIKKIDQENQTALGNEVINFYNRMLALQEEGTAEGVAFYLVNAAISSNTGILDDSGYGTLTSAPGFVYIHGDSYSSTTKDDNETTISGSGVKECITYLKEAKLYLEVIDTI